MEKKCAEVDADYKQRCEHANNMTNEVKSML